MDDEWYPVELGRQPRGGWKSAYRTWQREAERILRITPAHLRPVIAEQLRAFAPTTKNIQQWVPTREEMLMRRSVWSTGMTPVLEYKDYFSRYQPLNLYSRKPDDNGAIFMSFTFEPT